MVIHIVMNSLGRGGAERSALLLLEQLVREGVAARLICLFPIADAYEPVASIRPHVTFLGAPSFVRACWRLAAGLRPVPGDIVFSLMPQANIAAVLVARLRGLRVVTSERTTPLTWYSPRFKLWLALLPHLLSWRAVFISRHALETGLPASHIGSAIKRKSAVLHNPVPCPVPVNEAAHARRERVRRVRAFVGAAGLAGEPPLRLLIASRLAAGKGIVQFLRLAAPGLRRPGLQLVIAGTGPLEAELRATVQQLSLSDKVLLQGFVEDIFGAYREADVVLLTSSSEGFGRVGFEAYGAGCLVVGTQHNSFPAEVIGEHAAWQIADDLAGLAELPHALQALARQPVPEGGEDIARLHKALGLAEHASRFMALLAQERRP